MIQEEERLFSMMQLERAAKARGYRRVAGVDEAGRGPLAGPVVAAACVFSDDAEFEGIDDSKKLSERERERLFHEMTSSSSVDYGIGIIDAEIIDSVNILQATLLAMLAAVKQLSTPADFLLVDGSHLPKGDLPGEAIVKGDSRSLSIAAASILAKHTRDQLMLLAHEKWPDYQFDRHKGYPTKRHREIIVEKGPCPIHRKTFLKRISA